MIHYLTMPLNTVKHTLITVEESQRLTRNYYATKDPITTHPILTLFFSSLVV